MGDEDLVRGVGDVAANLAGLLGKASLVGGERDNVILGPADINTLALIFEAVESEADGGVVGVLELNHGKGLVGVEGNLRYRVRSTYGDIQRSKQVVEQLLQ